MCTHSSISTSTVLYTFNAMQCEYWSTRNKIKGSKSHPFTASQWTKKGLGLVCDFPHWCQVRNLATRIFALILSDACNALDSGYPEK